MSGAYLQKLESEVYLAVDDAEESFLDINRRGGGSVTEKALLAIAAELRAARIEKKFERELKQREAHQR